MYSVRLSDGLVAAIEARTERDGIPASEQFRRAMMVWLALTPPEQPPPMPAAAKPKRAKTATSAPAILIEVPAIHTEPLCRCGHKESIHSSKGCYRECMCRQFRSVTS